MENGGKSTGWSLRFKRQLVSWSIIAATPIVQLVARFSSIPKPVLFKISIASFVSIVLGCAYVFTNMTSKPEEPTSRRESRVLGIALTVVIALVVANCYFLFSGPATAATPVR